VVLLAGSAAAITVVEDGVDGGPPRGVLPAGPVAVTIVVGEDVDGGPSRGCCWRVWQ
jgi:hypothetical protein